MDGFAVRAADTPGTLPVVFRIAAGPARRRARCEPGEAMGIATGGVVPEGADAVIPIEYVVENENSVEIGEPVAPGANVRPRGGDVRAGDEVVAAGTRARRRAARRARGRRRGRGRSAARCRAPPCWQREPSFAGPGEPLGPGEIYEANGLILAAQLRSAGASVERLAAVADDEDAHREALARGLEHDVLVTSGGVSVGPHDLVRADRGRARRRGGLLARRGEAGQAGRRSACGSATLVFGLPGNPVSSLVGFELFVRPAVLALQGHADPLPRFEPGRLAAAARRNPARDELVRARTRSTRGRRGRARAAGGPGVAHDRRGRRGGRARARSARRGRARGRLAGALPQARLRRSALRRRRAVRRRACATAPASAARLVGSICTSRA